MYVSTSDDVYGPGLSVLPGKPRNFFTLLRVSHAQGSYLNGSLGVSGVNVSSKTSPFPPPQVSLAEKVLLLELGTKSTTHYPLFETLRQREP